MMDFRWLLVVAVPALGFAEPESGTGDLRHWAQWRGPMGNGEAPGADPPVTWSEAQNVRWKTPLPGIGHSSPVVWGDRIFLTASIESGEDVPPPVGRRPGEHDNILTVKKTKFVVLAVDRRNGGVVWQTVVRDRVPHEARHNTGSYASGSPVTDGKRVFAFFGSHGLYCLDRGGKVLWERDLGDMHSKHAHGEGSSPALHGDTLVVNWDHEGPSFVVALDKRTGKERWKADRDEPTSWSSPHVLVHQGKSQVVIAAANRIRSYELATGKVIWECGGLSHNVVSSPVSANGMVICGSSYEKQSILGIRLEGAKGDLTGTEHVVWFKRRDTPYVPSLLLHEGLVYYLRHYQGVLTCRKAGSGEEVYARLRLPGIQNVYSSPVSAKGRIYITSMDGHTVVFSAGPEPRILGRSQLDDSFSASAALCGKELFLRGHKALYCLAEE